MANIAFFRFYAELNDFLSVDRRHIRFPYRFDGEPAVKDSIEALGVPHAEVDLILINSDPTGFSHRLKHGDEVSVYPVFESLDISTVTHLRPEPLREPRFILDVHLGKLARYLRMCGFDTMYNNAWEDHEIVRTARREHRIILTRDVGLLKHGSVTHGYWVRSQHVRQQLREAIQRFDLSGSIQPFRRCLVCNGTIERVSKETVADRLQLRTVSYYNEFHRCCSCGRIYWKGSHWERMQSFMTSLRDPISHH